MRRCTLLLVALAGCGSARAAPASSPDALATVQPGYAALDEAHGQLFVRRPRGIEVRALASGKQLGTIDLGWDGTLWTTGRHLVAVAQPAGLTIETAVIDPAAARLAGTCKRTVTAPPGAVLMSVDGFTSGGTSYVKWQTAAPSQQRGGAAMRPEEIDQMRRDFETHYACGVFALRTTSSGCQLEPTTPAKAGLADCGSPAMPSGARVMPEKVGDLQLAVVHGSGGSAAALEETWTLLVSARGGHELWRTEVEHMIQYAPPPAAHVAPPRLPPKAAQGASTGP